MTWRPWQQAWHDALYGDTGFYRRPEGPAGHFATSAQGIPGVGEVLARTVLTLAQEHQLRAVVDVGAGRGELLAALHHLDPALHLVGVDVVGRPADLPATARWIASPGGAELPDETYQDALVLAHEWLDVVPAPVVEVDDSGDLRTVEVSPNGDERLGSTPCPADAKWCARHWPLTTPGQRAEVGRSRDLAWESLCHKVSHGLVVAVDYGHEASARPPHGTLTAFKRGREVPPQPDGSCDLTAHLAVDSLRADRRVRQSDLVRQLDLIPETPDVRGARTDPPGYLAALAARSAALHAAARPGLGDFWWVLRQVE